jgi:hypothetical protein
MVDGFGRPLIPGPVGSVPVVVVLILRQDLSCVAFVEYQHMVQCLASDAPDHAFAVGVHAGCLRCAEQDVDAFGLEDRVEGGCVLGVAVP